MIIAALHVDVMLSKPLQANMISDDAHVVSIFEALTCHSAGQHGACLIDNRFDTYTPCHYGNSYTAHKIVAYVGLGVYIWMHFWYVHVGRKHHSILPYTSFRYCPGILSDCWKFALLLRQCLSSFIYRSKNQTYVRQCIYLSACLLC